MEALAGNKVHKIKRTMIDKHKLGDLAVSGITLAIAYFSPTLQFLMFISFMVIADVILGAVAAVKNGDLFSWMKLFNKAGMFVSYVVILLVAFVICGMFAPKFPGLELVGGMIGWKELKSIDKNTRAITGFSAFTVLLNILKANNDKLKKE